MKLCRYLLSPIASVVFLATGNANAVCYVSQNAHGKNDGSSWTDAYVHPQLALLNSCAEIWVAKGVYTPAWLGSDPTVSFNIPADTKIYGGFAGGETSVDQRLPMINLTVLSGDIDHNDVRHSNWMDQTPDDIRGTNSYHVVTMNGSSASPITSDTVLDGFLITAGYASSGDADVADGGAIYCGADDLSGECCPTLANLIVVGNKAGDAGGATAFEGRVGPHIINSMFSNNFAYGHDGGAVYISSSDSTIKSLIVNCALSNNGTNGGGGAVSVHEGAIEAVNTTFFSNAAFAGFGGGISIYGDGSLSLINTTFVNNYSSEGGGAVANRLFTRTGGGAILVSNSIFWANESTSGQPDIHDYGTDLAYVATSVLEHDCPDALSVCLNVSTADPKLSSPADHGGSTVTMLPGVGGSAIDNGDDATCAKYAPTDQRGISRPQGAHCDIGAVEWQPSDDVIFRNGFQ